MLRFVAVSAVACALALTPNAADAQSQQERDRTARAEFTAGRDAFSHGDYADAAARFQHAYQLSQRRELLFNIGTAYERLHRWVPARDAFQGYLEAFPNAPERDELRGRLSVIEQEIARDAERANSPSPEPTNTTTTVVRERVVVREVPAETHSLRTAGIVFAGLGVISGIASVSIALATNAHFEELANTCGATVDGCLATDISDIQLRATLTNIFAVGAGVLAATGVALVVVDLVRGHGAAPERAHASRDWHFGLSPTRDGGGIVFSGAF